MKTRSIKRKLNTKYNSKFIKSKHQRLLMTLDKIRQIFKKAMKL